MDKTTNISVTIKQSVYEAIKQIAEDDRRSFSAMVNIILEDYLAARGEK